MARTKQTARGSPAGLPPAKKARVHSPEPSLEPPKPTYLQHWCFSRSADPLARVWVSESVEDGTHLGHFYHFWDDQPDDFLPAEFLDKIKAFYHGVEGYDALKDATNFKLTNKLLHSTEMYMEDDWDKYDDPHVEKAYLIALCLDQTDDIVKQLPAVCLGTRNEYKVHGPVLLYGMKQDFYDDAESPHDFPYPVNCSSTTPSACFKDVIDVATSQADDKSEVAEWLNLDHAASGYTEDAGKFESYLAFRKTSKKARDILASTGITSTYRLYSHSRDSLIDLGISALEAYKLTSPTFDGVVVRLTEYGQPVGFFTNGGADSYRAVTKFGE